MSTVADTISHPRTMMIHFQYTSIANRTMMSSGGFDLSAFITVSESDHVQYFSSEPRVYPIFDLPSHLFVLDHSSRFFIFPVKISFEVNYYSFCLFSSILIFTISVPSPQSFCIPSSDDAL